MIYGTSTVLARMLNFCLVPFYTYYLAAAEYGVISTVFAMVALFNVVYIFGLDQAYLRFASETKNEKQVFLQTFYGVFCWGAILSVLLYFLAGLVAEALGLGAQSASLVRLAAFILFLDVLNLIPFTKLRLQHRAWYFAGVRVASICVNVALNIVFIAVFKMGVEAILWANIFGSLASLILLSPVVFGEMKGGAVITLDKGLRRKMLSFAWPFVPSGMASMLVNVIDKPLLVYLAGLSAVGVYQANVKIGIFMLLIVSMFDQAWRPFFLSHAGDKQLFSKVFTLFFALALFCALGISFLMPDIIKFPLFGKHLISPAYWGGLKIIPFIIFGYFFYGLYINFMVAPVLTKSTKILLVSAVLGAVVSVGVNLAAVPRIGIMGAGLAFLLSYISMAAVLFVFLQIKFPIIYEYKKIFAMVLTACAAGAACYAHDVFLLKCGALLAYALITFFILRKNNVTGNPV